LCRADFEAALAEGRESETKEIQQTLVKVFGLGSLGLSSELLDKVMLRITGAENTAAFR
jgi:hypothetical protein